MLPGERRPGRLQLADPLAQRRDGVGEGDHGLELARDGRVAPLELACMREEIGRHEAIVAAVRAAAPRRLGS